MAFRIFVVYEDGETEEVEPILYGTLEEARDVVKKFHKTEKAFPYLGQNTYHIRDGEGMEDEIHEFPNEK